MSVSLRYIVTFALFKYDVCVTILMYIVRMQNILTEVTWVKSNFNINLDMF